MSGVYPGSKLHELKCRSDVYWDAVQGSKTFEFRKNDRGFKAGDLLLLREWCPVDSKYGGDHALFKVTYIIYGPDFEIPPEYCVMGIKKAELTLEGESE